MDEIIELCNIKNLGYQELLKGVDVVKKSGSEVFVVKDFEITNDFSRNLNFSIDDVSIFSTDTSCRLSGNEIISQNQYAKIKLNGKAQFNEFFTLISGSGNFYKWQIPTVYQNDRIPSSTYPNVTSQNITPLAGSATFFCFDSYGNFFYAINNGAMLYRRSGGVNGVQTAYSFGSQAFCFDGERYIYAFDGANIFSFDVKNLVINKMSLPFNFGITASASALDGKIFIHSGNNSNWFVDSVSGAYFPAASLSGSAGNACSVGLGKDSSGNYVAWQTEYVNSIPGIYWWVYGRNLQSGISPKQGGVSQNALIPYSLSPGIIQCSRQIGSDSRFLIVGNGRVFIFDTNAKSLVDSSSLAYHNFQNSSICFFSDINADLAASDFGKVDVRVAGIKTSNG
ncbi:hypothetical protein [Pseudoduganella violacea]|uniref:Uncharacterized protein n=1 Tax=Pseudoduganella violacea TaxID=1715466 RepID=A0A7W5B8Q8_9BURK|nr:hypothetical protein [Pseudoduganella violacea]MBB3118622.1 hypothetical protein [Pseudoduganella violacea]